MLPFIQAKDFTMAKIVGTNGPDSLVGGRGNDSVLAAGGDDTLR